MYFYILYFIHKNILIMKTINKLLIFSLALFTISCATLSVSYDYDRSVDFNKLKTYKWLKKKMPNNALDQNPFQKKAIIKAVNDQLLAKGYKEQESEDADFAVNVYSIVKQQTQITNWDNYGWYNPWWGPYGGHTEVSTYDEGTLVIDIIDIKDKELAWRGLGTKIVTGFSNDANGIAIVNENIAKIMVNFPPPAVQGK